MACHLLGEQGQVLAGDRHALNRGPDDVTVSNRNDVCHTCGSCQTRASRATSRSMRRVTAAADSPSPLSMTVPVRFCSSFDSLRQLAARANTAAYRESHTAAANRTNASKHAADTHKRECAHTHTHTHTQAHTRAHTNTHPARRYRGLQRQKSQT